MSGIAPAPDSRVIDSDPLSDSTEPGKPIRIGILGSTKGTDLQAILDAVEAGSLDAEIALVISDKKQAYILERAELHNIPSLWISTFTRDKMGTKVKKSRELFDAEVTGEFRKRGVELILMIGYMRIVSAEFCTEWEGKLLNVHPSLLPDFAGGMDGDVHTAVLKAGRDITGCTVHQVTAEVDAGPIVVQLSCPVYPEDTPEALKKRVQALEGRALIQAIEMAIQNR